MSALPDWSRALPAHLAPVLAEAASARLPPNVALMRILGEAAEECEARRALTAAVAALDAAGRDAETERLRRIEALWRASPGAWSLIRSVLAEADHDATAKDGEAAVAGWAAAFDRLAEKSPEAAVALYSLGRPDLLEAATQELVRLVHAWGLLGTDRTVLDLGCGIGRVAAALAGDAGSIVGADVSAAMIAAARRRCAGLQNVRLVTTDGRDLSAFADESFDLVLAVDVFPYLVQAGLELAARYVAEAARVLRSGGALLIFNFSYRGDLDTDRAELAGLARSSGLIVSRAGTRDLDLWDGAAFLIAKRERIGADAMDAGRRRP